MGVVGRVWVMPFTIYKQVIQLSLLCIVYLDLMMVRASFVHYT